MKNKKLWIGIAAVILFVVIAIAYLNYRNRSVSPPGSATLTSGGMTITVNYSRPSVRGRVIFGNESQSPLLPYGKYWRLGANESTEITINRDVLFNGTPVKAGTYWMYAIPGPETFDIVLNSELGKWGAWEPNYDKDVMRTKIPVKQTTASVEQFTISLAPEGAGIDVICEFATTRLVIPILPQ
jgi:hypothetical protein